MKKQYVLLFFLSLFFHQGSAQGVLEIREAALEGAVEGPHERFGQGGGVIGSVHGFCAGGMRPRP